MGVCGVCCLRGCWLGEDETVNMTELAGMTRDLGLVAEATGAPVGVVGVAGCTSGEGILFMVIEEALIVVVVVVVVHEDVVVVTGRVESELHLEVDLRFGEAKN